MGTWCAIAAHDLSLSVAAHDSLATCIGHLTSPPSITAAVAYPQPGMAALLQDDVRTDLERRWDAAGFATAALTHLAVTDGGADAMPSADRDDAEVVDKLVALGRALRT
jgi:hypothetical protein